jgi:hypothetical protein
MDGDIDLRRLNAREAAEGGLDLLTELGALASDCLAPRFARAIFSGTALPFAGALPAWRDRFGTT